jgi:hypothetical protein
MQAPLEQRQCSRIDTGSAQLKQFFHDCKLFETQVLRDEVVERSVE